MLEIHDNAYLIIINLKEKVSIEIHRPYLFLFFFLGGEEGMKFFYFMERNLYCQNWGEKFDQVYKKCT